MNQLLVLDMMLLPSHVRIAVLVNLFFEYHRQESVDGTANCRDLLENGRAISFLGDDFFQRLGLTANPANARKHFFIIVNEV